MQQPQGPHGQQNGQDLYAFAGHARKHVHEHVHRDVLFPVECLNGTEKGDVDEKKARPLFAGGITSAKHIAQKGIVEDQTDHPQKDDRTENFKKQFARQTVPVFGSRLPGSRCGRRFGFAAHHIPLHIGKKSAPAVSACVVQGQKRGTPPMRHPPVSNATSRRDSWRRFPGFPWHWERYHRTASSCACPLPPCSRGIPWKACSRNPWRP